ncbi:hypothetical protein AAMO2058_001545700 [Amorphochlora amoebiformis]|uniref:SKP1 component POZ domain-containing protein n=1 Tax=Amorphochlora amoebiformis TaxID=1561963 RepID=A0A7S0DR73_9EUKA|mmetsp:Transcript_6882/g.10656  ORF Transcript_6882/g.10656 Transcript_6882/m.10656 type:complete len:212 (+) Transcript_6882:26-661(+)|eukprot:1368783-Amorphochlora_amoeboformis.AAC.1
METGGLDEIDKKSDAEKEIILISGDGRNFPIKASYASISGMIKTSLLDQDTKEITLKDIRGEILEKIVKYMENREGKDMEEMKWPIKHKDMVNNVGKGNEWCAKFIDEEAKHRKNFYDMLLATVRLDIKGLQNLGVGKIASLLKFCDASDLDRVLDPAITDGKLLPLRESIVVERKKEEEERLRRREERKKAREAKEAKEAENKNTKTPKK